MVSASLVNYSADFESYDFLEIEIEIFAENRPSRSNGRDEAWG